MTRLILIRHGVSQWNTAGRYCGHKDISLSKTGKSQIRMLSQRLDKAGFDKIYSSTLKRAVQSARILFKREKIILRRGLKEIDFGILEGLRHEEILKAHADVYRNWLKDPFKNRIPKAETMKAFKKRVEDTLRKIVRSNAGRTIAVVCHGGVIGILVNSISKRRNLWRSIPSPASITLIECGNGRPNLKIFNDTTHLEAKDG